MFIPSVVARKAARLPSCLRDAARSVPPLVHGDSLCFRVGGPASRHRACARRRPPGQRAGRARGPSRRERRGREGASRRGAAPRAPESRRGDEPPAPSILFPSLASFYGPAG